MSTFKTIATIVLIITYFSLDPPSGYTQISLVKDINTNNSVEAGSSFNFGETLNGYTYFSGQNELGDELWRTDGTMNGTHLFKDLDPGTPGTTPSHFILLNNKIIFTAQDITYGNELWVTNGSEYGTNRLRDINIGATGSYPDDFVRAGNYVYFIAYMPNTSSKLWRTDGTSTGTILVKDLGINEIENAVHPALVVMNGEVYFSAMNSGFELWKSDGTVDGTVKVKGNFLSPPIDLFVSNNQVYFQADDGVHGSELWKTDGTEPGTQLIKDISLSSSNPSNFHELNGTVFFVADDGIHGAEMWKTDGTENGTTLLRDICIGSTGSDPMHISLVGNQLFFSAYTPSTGRELFVTNGNSAGTVLITEVNPGTSDGIMSDNSTMETIVFGNQLFFRGIDNAHGIELWKTDGTTAGTSLVIDLAPGPAIGLTEFHYANGTRFYFSGTNGTSTQLYTSNGNTVTVLYTAPFIPGSSNPSNIYAGNSALYMKSSDASTPATGLWKSDGTDPGTQNLLTSNGDQIMNPNSFTNLGSISVFIGTVGSDQLLMATNGTSSGTFPLSPDPFAQILGKLGNRIVFQAYSPSTGDELYISDGTVAGTHFVKDITPGISASTFIAGYEYNGYYYFSAGSLGASEFWRTDGTTAGTVLFSSVAPTFTSHTGFTLGLLNNQLIFQALGNNGVQFWKTDGTSSGTQLIEEINDNGNQNSPANINSGVVFNNRLFFSFEDGVHGYELWRTDGNTIELIKDINPGPASGGINSIRILNNTLYFAANDGIHGFELWKSSGELNNAELVVDFYPGAYSSEANPEIVFNNKLYFTANNGSLGREVWCTDGSIPGTYLCGDLNDGILSSSPDNFTLFANNIYFGAVDETYGRELWKLNPQTPSLPIISQTISACDKYYSDLTQHAYFHNGMYVDTLQDVNNVDSIIVYSYITINTSQYFTQIFSSCDPFEWIDGHIYSASTNTAMYYQNNVHNCDSIITLNLTIYEHPAATIYSSGDTLYATGGTFYHWIECNSNQNLGAYDSIYVPTETGSYACIVSNNFTCSDTTECIPITVDLEINHLTGNFFNLFPNPSNGLLQVDLASGEKAILYVLDTKGSVLLTKNIGSTEKTDLSFLSSGTYFIRIQTDHDNGLKKWIKID